MNLTRRILRVYAAALLLFSAACTTSGAQEGPLILAASSLQEALSEAAETWTAQGHAKPVISFAASSALARQIEAGAQADIFISADEDWMDEVAGKGMVQPGTRVSLLGNSLALIAPKGSSAKVDLSSASSLAEAIDGGWLAMANPDSVPAGRYAKEALTTLHAWQSVKAKIVPAENVRSALTLVARKETALGIVYATDARAEPSVQIIGKIPSDSHKQISYPMAVLATSTHPDTKSFCEFLLSDEAKEIFRKYGFEATPTP